MIKIGRNDPCPCGSGKKYKRCCYVDVERNERILRAASRVSTQEELIALLNRPIEIYRLRIKLESIRSDKTGSTVSRTIEIEGDNTLYDLHWEIQTVFGWDNDHLFSFYMSNRLGDSESEYSGNPLGGDPSSTEAEPSGTAAQTEIRYLGLKKGARFKYLLDYGDYLIHTVEVLGAYERGDENETYLRVIEKLGEPPSQYGYSEE